MTIKEKLESLKQKVLDIFQSEGLTEEEQKVLLQKTFLLNLGDFPTSSIIGYSFDNGDNKIKDNSIDLSLVDLNAKVNNFIDWYYKNMVKGNYSEIGEYHFPKDMRNLIEKIAVWYELRYPDYEINKLMPSSTQEFIDINEVMFKNNPYINDLTDENSDARQLDWNEFYNANAFIRSLPWEERCYFAKPRYGSIAYLNGFGRSGAHVHLTRNGNVYGSEGISEYTNGVIEDKSLMGLNIKKVVDIFKEKGISLPKNNEVEKAIKQADNWQYQKDEMLNCAMYRIIERGGNRIGPRRAFLFAKEFGRNIDIPMKYAVDYSDPGLESFALEYLNAGGSKNLECYEGYLLRTSNRGRLKTVTVGELITKENDKKEGKSLEETEVYQKLVNVLASQVDQETVKKEKIAQLRLERKLAKSRTNNSK